MQSPQTPGWVPRPRRPWMFALAGMLSVTTLVGCSAEPASQTTAVSMISPSGSDLPVNGTAANSPVTSAVPTSTAPSVPSTTTLAAPTVTITRPVADDVFDAGAPVDVEAALDPRRPIVQALLMVDGQGAAVGQYPVLRWENASPGDHILTVSVDLEGGGSITSAPLVIHVNQPPPPTPPPPTRAAQPPAGTFFATVRTDINVRYHPDVSADVVELLHAGSVVAVRCWAQGGPYESGGNGYIDYFWARVVVAQGENWVADGFLNTPRNDGAYPDYNEC